MYGAFLLAVYNDDDETFQTISKIGTGFTDERLKDLHEQMKDHVIASPASYYRSALPCRHLHCSFKDLHEQMEDYIIASPASYHRSALPCMQLHCGLGSVPQSML